MTSITEKIRLQIAEEKRKSDERVKQLAARLEQAEARKVQALIKGKRAEDTRRKILAGALVLDMMEKDEEAKKRLLARFNTYLTRDDDRALFGLPQLSATAAPQSAGGENAPKTTA